jgi:hypothetical protein
MMHTVGCYLLLFVKFCAKCSPTWLVQGLPLLLVKFGSLTLFIVLTSHFSHIHFFLVVGILTYCSTHYLIKLSSRTLCDNQLPTL